MQPFAETGPVNSELTAALLDAVPMPLVLIGRDERVKALNAAARDLFGTGGAGRHYMTVLRAPPLIDCVEAALRSGGAAEARHLASEAGRETEWRVAARPLAGPGPEGVLVSFEDVTALAAAGQMRRDFVTNVSHELKTPLTALSGFIETLGGAAREAERMNRLVDDLLSLNRVESEERVRPRQRVDLAALAGAALLALRPMAGERGVTLDLVGGETPHVVTGDADQLTQVLTNLVENALKYAASGKLVTVRLARDARDPAFQGPGIRLEVIDRGEGFDPVHIPRLTERFYRIDTHRSRAEGGTGLGLAIVKHIVSRHRGRFRIESAPGQGSRFIVSLPAA